MQNQIKGSQVNWWKYFAGSTKTKHKNMGYFWREEEFIWPWCRGKLLNVKRLATPYIHYFIYYDTKIKMCWLLSDISIVVIDKRGPNKTGHPLSGMTYIETIGQKEICLKQVVHIGPYFKNLQIEDEECEQSNLLSMVVKIEMLRFRTET